MPPIGSPPLLGFAALDRLQVRDMSASLIEASLELAAERCEDLTPLVYERLFREHPEMEALFWRDTNHAVKGEMLARVFEAYYTTKEKGTGLGLAIVKHNVDLYGGTIRVESALGNGAVFTLLFPAVTPIKIHNSA